MILFPDKWDELCERHPARALRPAREKVLRKEKHLRRSVVTLLEYLDDVATLLEHGIDPAAVAEDIRRRAANLLEEK